MIKGGIVEAVLQ